MIILTIILLLLLLCGGIKIEVTLTDKSKENEPEKKEQ